MIEIKKAENISQEQFMPPLEAFELTDAGELYLLCIYEMKDGKVEIFDIREIQPSPIMFYDAILRSIMAYGISMGAGSMGCKNKELFEKLEKLGFTYSNDNKSRVYADAQVVLKHNCK